MPKPERGQMTGCRLCISIYIYTPIGFLAFFVRVEVYLFSDMVLFIEIMKKAGHKKLLKKRSFISSLAQQKKYFLDAKKMFLL
jgi:hypothetical protein